MRGIKYNTSMKIVIDTNVIVSGLQSDMGYSHKLLKTLASGKFQISISVPLILEYEAQLKKHLPQDIFTEGDIDAFLNYICKIGHKTPIYYLWRPYLKDPFDDHVLELALASHSQYIVTFNVKDFSNVDLCGIEIVKPSEFLNILGERW